MNLAQMIRFAASLPDERDRRALVAAIRVAVSPDTEDFVEWVLATQKSMTESEVTKFLEAKLGRTPDPAPLKGQSGRKSGALDVGEKVLVDKTKNTNTLNTDACAQYHNRVGQVSEKTPEGLVIQFYDGDNNTPSNTLTQEKQLFNGFLSGAKSGLYRWTSRVDYQETSVGKKVLLEVIYLRGGEQVDTRRMDMIEEYVDKGVIQGENRSTIYFTGLVGRFAENQQGEVYFSLSTMQRDTATSINPTKGKVLYIGVAGHRPGGWMEDAVKLGLRAP